MRIFYDVDTQNDFMYESGALYVPDAESIKPNLEKLTQYALKQKMPIVGSVDRHFGTEKYKARESELKRWGGPFPDHCMDRTGGVEKIAETFASDGQGLFNGHSLGYNRIFIPHELDGHVDRVLLAKGITYIADKNNYENGSLMFEKQSYDIFTNPALELFLKFADVKEAVVYGVATDYCVKAAVLGMQTRGIQCYVVEDAIKGITPETTKKALDKMKEAGARFVNTNQVLEDMIR
jgi:nicotinamidase/pyrazinamidase